MTRIFCNKTALEVGLFLIALGIVKENIHSQNLASPLPINTDLISRQYSLFQGEMVLEVIHIWTKEKINRILGHRF